MKKYILAIFILLLVAKPAVAFCPVCLIGTGLGAGLIYLLTDNYFLAGLLTGAFMVSLIIWLFKSAKKNQLPIIYIILAILIGIIFWFIAEKILIFGFIYGFISFAVIVWLTKFLQQQWIINNLSAIQKLLVFSIFFISLLFIFSGLRITLTYIFNL